MKIIFFHHQKFLKLNFKLKIDTIMCTYKDLDEVLKTWREFAKNIWQPFK